MGSCFDSCRTHHSYIDLLEYQLDQTSIPVSATLAELDRGSDAYLLRHICVHVWKRLFLSRFVAVAGWNCSRFAGVG